MKNALLILAGISLFACSKKKDSISPTRGDITESIYASGTVKSVDQYQAYVSVSGIIEEIFVKEGQLVDVGTPLLRVSNETQRYNLENATLAANFNDAANNQGKLIEAEALVQTAKAKLKLDSSLYARQKTLWTQQVGTRVEFEQKELNYQSAKANYLSANQRYKDLKRQINFSSAQAKKNVQISARQSDDFILKSKVKGSILSLLKEKGATFGNNQDLRVMIPAQIARSIFSAPNINYDIDVKINNEALLNEAVDQATLTMRKVRRLSPIEEENFGIKRSDDLIQRIMENTKTLSIAAWVIGIITIFGSSIALMNIMLVSVSERTREIGIRKSLGAKRSTIAWRFFTETFVISQLGGFLGILLGILLGSGIAIAIGFSFTVPWIG